MLQTAGQHDRWCWSFKTARHQLLARACLHTLHLLALASAEVCRDFLPAQSCRCRFNHPDGREIDEKPIGGKACFANA